MKRPRLSAAFAALVFILVAALQLPYVTAPFGAGAVNAGCYFGPFAKVWEHFGFATLRGMPVIVSTLEHPTLGTLYTSHPPGTAWVLGALGAAEWQLRLPTIVGALVTAWLLMTLLQRALGPVRAGVAGLLAACIPNTMFYSQVSYELLVMPTGLLAMLAVVRLLDSACRRWVWWATLLGCLLVGPWLDWAFAFWAAALTPFLVTALRPRRALLATLGVAAITLAGFGLVLFWKSWALGSELLPAHPGSDLGQILKTTLARPTVEVFVTESLDRLTTGFTWPVLALAVLGGVFALRRAPVLSTALLLPGVLNVAVFARHATGHVFYFAYLVPFVVAAAVSIPLPGHHVARRFAVLVVMLTLTFATSRSVEALEIGARPFFRRLGQTVDSASAIFEGGRPVRAWRVHYTASYLYPYYSRSMIAYPSPTVAVLEADLKKGDVLGLRCLLLDVEFTDKHGEVHRSVTKELSTYLERFPSRDVPELVGVVANPARGASVVVKNAKLYTLKSPRG